MIYIDFQGGAHGNYLAFVINKLYGVSSKKLVPFDSDGASHFKEYTSEIFCECDHYSYDSKEDPIKHARITNAKVISIKIDVDDLLPLSQISLLRGGNFNFDINELHIDTYNKFNHPRYRIVNETIHKMYFLNQLITDYNNIKAHDWPKITSFDDFDLLPNQIRSECINVFGVGSQRYDNEHPDCPKEILYDFYYRGFLNPECHGFMVKQRELAVYDQVESVYYFDFSCFYDENKFLNEIKNVTKWVGIESYDVEYLKYLHSEFLKRQIYKDSKIKSDALINSINMGEKVDMSGFTLMEHAYIDAKLIISGNERIFSHLYKN